LSIKEEPRLLNTLNDEWEQHRDNCIVDITLHIECKDRSAIRRAHAEQRAVGLRNHKVCSVENHCRRRCGKASRYAGLIGVVPSQSRHLKWIQAAASRSHWALWTCCPGISLWSLRPRSARVPLIPFWSCSSLSPGIALWPLRSGRAGRKVHYCY